MNMGTPADWSSLAAGAAAAEVAALRASRCCSRSKVCCWSLAACRSASGAVRVVTATGVTTPLPVSAATSVVTARDSGPSVGLSTVVSVWTGTGSGGSAAPVSSVRGRPASSSACACARLVVAAPPTLSRPPTAAPSTASDRVSSNRGRPSPVTVLAPSRAAADSPTSCRPSPMAPVTPPAAVRASRPEPTARASVPCMPRVNGSTCVSTSAAETGAVVRKAPLAASSASPTRACSGVMPAAMRCW